MTFTQCKGFSEVFFGGIEEPLEPLPFAEGKPLPLPRDGGGGTLELFPPGGGGAEREP